MQGVTGPLAEGSSRARGRVCGEQRVHGVSGGKVFGNMPASVRTECYPARVVLEKLYEGARENLGRVAWNEHTRDPVNH